jgi:NAD(P)-dependent dehydrogenase (short-subunit alcohol dehydrogenase family)
VQLNDFTGKAVIVTGGTKGIGLATGLAFGREGAHVFLTHRWGSADEAEIKQQFAAIGAPEPAIVEADVAEDADTVALLERVRQDHESVEVLVSNVCVVQPAQGIESYRKRSLLGSLRYSAWPFIGYVQHVHTATGRYPRYVVGISSDGADRYFSRYEFVAASKAVMETLCRYASTRLADEDIRLNVLRTRNVPTDAIAEIFGSEYVEFMGKYAGPEYFIRPEEVGDCVLAMCSGLLDVLNGQVISVDKGSAFSDSLLSLMERREQLGLDNKPE